MTTNKQTLENIESTLNAIAVHMGITPGDASAPALDPIDPLNEISQNDWRATDANDSEEERANNILRESGEPRTIRNFLKALMRKTSADSWYTVRWDGTTLTLYDNRGDIASYDTRQTFPVGGSWHPKEDEVELFSGNGRIKPNACFGVGTFGRVLNLISDYGVKIVSEDGIAEARTAVRNIIALHGIQVRHGKSPKTRGPRGLPGINFHQVKAHVESTRYKEPEPKPRTTLEWGDYSALIEAIERADPKRKRKKPTPPPKPKKVREPESKRHNLWGWTLIAFELLAIVWICHIYATQGPYSPELGATCAVAALTSTVGIAALRSTDDQDE